MTSAFPAGFREKRATPLFSILAVALFASPGDAMARVSAEGSQAFLQAALTIARSIEDAESRVEVLQKIISVYTELGQKSEVMPIMDELLASVQEIKSREQQGVTLYRMAKLSAQFGNFPRALEASGQIEKPYWRTFALIQIAAQYTAAGMQAEALQMLSQARKTAAKVKRWKREYPMLLSRIGRAYAEAGEKEAADKLLVKAYSRVRRSLDPPYNLLAISTIYVETGELDKALKIANSKLPTHYRSMLMLALVSRYVENNQPEKALAAIETFSSQSERGIEPMSKILALVKVTNWYTERNETQTATELLSTAEKPIRKLLSKRKEEYTTAAIEIASGYTLMQKTDRADYYLARALAQTRKLKIPAQINLTKQIALAYAEAGRISKALIVLENLDKIYAKLRKRFRETDHTIRSSNRLDRIQGIVQINSLIRKVEDSYYKIKVLGAVSGSYARNGETDLAAKTLSEALRSIEPQQEARLTAMQLTEVAREYARAGVIPGASDMEYLDGIGKAGQTAE